MSEVIGAILLLLVAATLILTCVAAAALAWHCINHEGDDEA